MLSIWWRYRNTKSHHSISAQERRGIVRVHKAVGFIGGKTRVYTVISSVQLQVQATWSVRNEAKKSRTSSLSTDLISRKFAGALTNIQDTIIINILIDQWADAYVFLDFKNSYFMFMTQYNDCAVITESAPFWDYSV